MSFKLHLSQFIFFKRIKIANYRQESVIISPLDLVNRKNADTKHAVAEKFKKSGLEFYKLVIF